MTDEDLKAPETDGDKLRLIAYWFDRVYDAAHGPSDKEVQRDLRRIADRVDMLDRLKR